MAKKKKNGLHRRTKDGLWNYRFTINGKRYSGSTGQREEREAQREVSRLKRETEKSDTVAELHVRQRKHLIGNKRVELKEAFKCFMNKEHEKPMGEGRIRDNRGRWNNFVLWMKYHHVAVKFIHEITDEMAQGYIKRIAEDGRWDLNLKIKVSDNTRNEFQGTCMRVVKYLMKDAGVVVNPFDSVSKISRKKVFGRDIFTDEELGRIHLHATGWIRFIFMVGLHTGLREGDICMLKWDNVDLSGSQGWLNNIELRKTESTSGVRVDIIILPALRDYLEGLPHDEGQEYVYPQLAQMYAGSHSSLIGKKFGTFLRSEAVGIKTHEFVEGRTRKVQRKDVHSLRHTFVYIAGVYKVPLSIVQEVMGHMTLKMTQHYNKHSKRVDKENAMAKLDFLNIQNEEPVQEPQSFPADFQKLAIAVARMTSTLETVLTLAQTMNADNVDLLKPTIVSMLQRAKPEQEIRVETIQPAQISN